MKTSHMLIPERVLFVGVAVLILGTMLVAQYTYSPRNSLLTYLLLGSAGPSNRTLTACHITFADFPHGSLNKSSKPIADPTLAGEGMKMTGASALIPLFTKAANQFDAANGTAIAITSTDSTTGIEYAFDQLVDIGLSDYSASNDSVTRQFSSSLTDRLVAVDAFSMLVSPDISAQIQNLTHQEIDDIYSGKVTNWGAIGGPNEPIVVLNREDGSGARHTFSTYVAQSQNPFPTGQILPSTTAMVQALASAHGAIGYAPTSALIANSSNVSPVCIDGFGATTTNIQRGAYTFWNYEHLYTSLETPLSPLQRSFIQYVCGVQFQLNDVLGNGFLLVPQMTQAAVDTHPDTSLDASCLK